MEWVWPHTNWDRGKTLIWKGQGHSLHPWPSQVVLTFVLPLASDDSGGESKADNSVQPFRTQIQFTCKSRHHVPEVIDPLWEQRMKNNNPDPWCLERNTCTSAIFHPHSTLNQLVFHQFFGQQICIFYAINCWYSKSLSPVRQWW